MFWIFLLLCFGAVTFMQLGAYSVLVGLLSGALKVILIVVGLLVGLAILRKVLGRG